MAGEVPLTINQKVKFKVEEQLNSVAAKDDVIATLTTSNSYIKIDENVVECSFKSLEVVNTIFVEEGQKILTPRLLKVTRIGVKQTVRRRVRAGLGLKKYLQGRSKAMLVIMKQECYGLGLMRRNYKCTISY